MIEKPNYKRILFISDIHCPYHDTKSVSALCSFSKWYKPDTLVFLGDVIDFYAISHFVKDPKRALELQREIDVTKQVLKQITATVPKKVKKIMIAGNHEARLQKFLWTRAAELSGLDGLELANLLGLNDLGIKYYRNGRLKYKGMIFKHGDIVRKYAGYTARGEFDSSGMSGVSVHTHRLSQYYYTSESGEYLWTEAGCLCKLDQEYLRGKTPNWQPGFAIGYYKTGSQRFHVDVVPIVKGKAMYGGYEFS